MKINDMIKISKVVSKNFVSDFIGSIQNLFGMNLTVYESMTDKAYEQIIEEVKERGIKKLKWFRIETTQLTNGALLMTLYGEEE